MDGWVSDSVIIEGLEEENEQLKNALRKLVGDLKTDENGVVVEDIDKLLEGLNEARTLLVDLGW